MSTSAAEGKVVKKAGEGYDRPNADAELPIDINYQKLSEWLVQRQKLPADWHKRLQAIQAKVIEAVRDLPAGLLAGLPGGAEATVDYFRAVKIRDKLAQTGERTLFGALTGQAGVWDKIVKAYENQGVFIGEAAQTLVQNVDYEVPYLRKQMTKCNQQMADADRKHVEYTRSAETCANNYKKECEKLGISGSAVGQELRQLTNELPALFERLVQQMRTPGLLAAISCYQHFTQYAHGSGTGSTEQQQQQQEQLPDVLHVLMEVRERRTAPYEPGQPAADNNAVIHAASPEQGIDWGGLLGGKTPGNGGSLAGIGAGGGIDWGVDEAAAPAADDSNTAAAGISWDLGDATTAGDETGGISWEIAVEPPEVDAQPAAEGPILDWDIDVSGIGVEGAGDCATAAAAPAINWDIDMVDSAAAGTELPAGPAAAAVVAGGDEVVASSRDASVSRLQHDSDYRSQLQDDLQELRAFLISRSIELSSSSSSGNLLRALAPEVVSSTDAGDVQNMLVQVEELLVALNDDKMKRLLLISSSSRYMERMQASLERKAGQEAKMLVAAAETQARKQEARATLTGLQPKLQEIVEHTRSIKNSVEAALSKQFNGRRVNVLGEINNALAATV